MTDKNFTTIDWPRTQKLKHALSSLLFLLASIAVLVACGGDAAAPSATPALPAEATVETAVTEPTAVSVATDTIVDTIVAEIPPEATNTPEPTIAPEPTDPPAPAATSGSCDNPFFPVVEGRGLRYRNTIPGIDTSEYTITYSMVSDSTFTGTISFDDGEALIQEWTCFDGGLLSPQLIQLPGGTEGITVEYSDLEGLTLPPADQMQPGGSWTTRYTASATMPDTGDGSMTMIQVTDMVSTVTGTESVTVPAGTYENAVRVETTGNITMTMAIGDQTAPSSDIEMSYTSWYVEGIGLVRQEMAGLFGEGPDDLSVTELVAIE